MPKYTLTWSSQHLAYELRAHDGYIVLRMQQEEPAWFAWLSQGTSFIFEGRMPANCCLLRQERKQRGDAYWYARRRNVSKYVGKTAAVTLARLEDVACILNADCLGQSPRRKKAAQPEMNLTHSLQPIELVAPEVNPDDEITPEYCYYIENVAYDESSTKYEHMSDRELMDSNTIIMCGHGCHIKVQNQALVLCHGRAKECKTITLYLGAHKVKQVIICSDSGYFTIGALAWCLNQDITVTLLDFSSPLAQVLTPKQPGNAKLIWHQYQASQSNVCIGIARELVRLKTRSQIEVIKSLPDKSELLISPIIQFLNDGLAELSDAGTVVAIQAKEGGLARCYWQAFVGTPISWDKRASKVIPPHWLSITGRESPLSQSGRYAINPFHASLNFAYALLEGQMLQSIIAAGLEPTCGFLHYNQEGQNSLCYDLMEPFRPFVDAKVLAFFQSTTLHYGDFYQTLTGECRMNDQLRRYILASTRLAQPAIDALTSWLLETLVKATTYQTHNRPTIQYHGSSSPDLLRVLSQSQDAAPDVDR